MIQLGLGEIITNPEPIDVGGPEIAHLRVYDPIEQAISWMVRRPGEANFAGRKWA